MGYRFGPHLGDTVPILIQYCKNASENDEELREYSLQVWFDYFILLFKTSSNSMWLTFFLCYNVNIVVQALESFLLRCPRDIFSYCNEILHLTLEYLVMIPISRITWKKTLMMKFMMMMRMSMFFSGFFLSIWYYYDK